MCAGGAVDLQTEAAVHVFAQPEMRSAASGGRVAGHRPAAAQRPRNPTGNRHVRHQTVLRLPNSSLRTQVSVAIPKPPETIFCYYGRRLLRNSEYARFNKP